MTLHEDLWVETVPKLRPTDRLLFTERDPFGLAELTLKTQRKQRWHLLRETERGPVVAVNGILYAHVRVNDHPVEVLGTGGLHVAPLRRGWGLGAVLVRYAWRLGGLRALCFSLPHRATYHEAVGWTPVPDWQDAVAPLQAFTRDLVEGLDPVETLVLGGQDPW